MHGWQVYEKSNVPWIEGTTIKTTEALKKSLDLACQFRDNNVVDKLEAWTQAWYASYREAKHIFAGCATWSVPFTIEPNDPDGKGSNHWESIKFATLSTEGAEALNSMGNLTSAEKPYEEKTELKSYKVKLSSKTVVVMAEMALLADASGIRFETKKSQNLFLIFPYIIGDIRRLYGRRKRCHLEN